PTFPSTVTDQIKLGKWNDLGVLLCEHEANRALVVSADGHEQSNQFLTLFTSDSKKHTMNLVSVSEVKNDQLKQHGEKSTHCSSVSLRFFISSLSAACKSSSYQ
ncbi:hypothetical protein Tsp_14562, partial [Trichinella spiralis]|uniref:hypothetical protein n=1 Tax=Trichinella spiralis TaxID=6334 RepID=UPI0001EFEFCB